MPKRLPLRLRLALLVAGTTLPLIIFSAAIVFLNYEANRKNASDRTLEVARGLMLTVDRELQSLTAALQVLALSQPLRSGDLEGFRTQASAFLGRQKDGANIVLIDRSGRQVLNMAVPPGVELPISPPTSAARAVLEKAVPAIGNYRIGEITKRPIVTVNVPVTRGGEVIYALAFSPTPERFEDIIREQRPMDGWVVAVLDADAINIARLPSPELFVGVRAAPTLYAELMRAREGVSETISLEGTPLLTAFSRSATSGWSVAVGIPRDALTRPLWRTLAATIGIGLAFLVVGLAFAVGMARRIARAEAHRELLINELNHRVKNTLTTVQSIAARTLRNAPDSSQAVMALEDRLIALSSAHNVLSAEKWESADLRDVVRGVLQPYARRYSERLNTWGENIRLKPRAALTIAMVLHELATNAAKYGALSNTEGRVVVEWAVVNASGGPMLRLLWTESGGPSVDVPERKGFGSTLIERSVTDELKGSTTLTFGPSGVTCRLDIPMSGLQAAGEPPEETVGVF